MSPEQQVPPDRTQTTVSGLQGGHTYRFGVRAVNEAGRSRATVSNPVVPLGPVLEGLAMLLQERGVALYNADGPSSIFLEYLPEGAEHALSLTIYGGDLETIFPASQTRPRVQVMARGDKRSPRWSRETSDRVYRVLHGYQGHLPNGADVHFCWGIQSAATSLGPDDAGRFLHSQNYEMWVGQRPAVPMEAAGHGLKPTRDAPGARVLQHSGRQRRALHSR